MRLVTRGLGGTSVGTQLVTQGFGGTMQPVIELAQKVEKLTRWRGRGDREWKEREAEIRVSARLMEVNGVYLREELRGKVAVVLKDDSHPRVRVIERTTSTKLSEIVIRVTRVTRR